MSDPHQVTRDFEAALCEYTGARFAVTTTSCTQALLMALAWQKARFGTQLVWMPNWSYVGVPAAVLNAGHTVAFCADEWEGSYGLAPDDGADWLVRDCAWQLEPGMFTDDELQCVSFHWTKPLGLGQGGCILLDDPSADAWLRRARFDGRTEGVSAMHDRVTYPSWHAYLSPEIAATGLMRLQSGAFRTDHRAMWSNYPDLSTLEAFK
jgi:dTDP-4-amino-4,6-dideoxygalactose transaminase